MAMASKSVIKTGMKSVPIYTVDAFTRSPFAGNPAAVCLLLKDDVSDPLKQKIANEMNLSETAFVTPRNAESFKTANQFNLRWFTPKSEVPLCGHATLATAAVIYEVYGNEASEIFFHTQSGQLSAKKGISDGFISLDMPLNPPQKWNHEDSVKDLIRTVIGTLQCDEVQYSGTTKKLLVRLNNSVTRTQLETINPDPQKMVKAHNSGEVKGMIVTLSSSHGNGKEGGGDNQMDYDFLSRYFAPWVGITEDPVTGSAHTVLAAYWSKILNKNRLLAFQCSPRGGELTMSIRDDQRVDILGQAAIIIEGELHLSL